MKLVKSRLRDRFTIPAVLVGSATIVAAVVFAAPASTGSAGDNALKLSVVATTKGPLTACPPPYTTCDPNSTVRYFLYVENKRPLLNPPSYPPSTGGPKGRPAIKGAFVMSSVDISYLVNGVVHPAWQGVTPPPNISTDGPRRAWAGDWPSTATCPGTPPWFTDSTDPCTIVGAPAILPGEKTVAFFMGWAHATEEPNGTYVFRFTLHGTVDGQPVDLAADSPSIVMTN
jgi:hypothetical protein